MARYRVLIQPTGTLNGRLWPEPGGDVELPESAGDPMVKGGWLEPVKANQKSDKAKTEKRPAPARNVETR